MTWLIQSDNYAKVQPRKDAQLDFRIDFSELRFVQAGDVVTVYAVAITKIEGTAALPKEKGAKWEPEYPLKVIFQLDSNGSNQEKAAIKLLNTLDPSKCYSGNLCVQNVPTAASIVTGQKKDGTPLPPETLEYLLSELGSFSEVTPSVIKDEDVKALEKKAGFEKKFKSKGEIAAETLTAIKALLGTDIVNADASFVDTAVCIDALPNKVAIYALLGVIF